jgi:hypothetical protein
VSTAQLWGRRLFLAVSWLFVAGLIAQVYLAGMGVFGGNFESHVFFGYTVTWLPVLMFLFGLIGRVGRLDIGLSALLFAQGILQSVFVLQRETSPAIAALHPVNGVAMLIIGIYLGIDAWRLLRAPAPEPATQAPEPAPQA